MLLYNKLTKKELETKFLFITRLQDMHRHNIQMNHIYLGNSI